ncbi:DNA polymerase III subunit alpha [Apilactobacillus apinorum]|uniref:DNA polymerase III subunit alpha n=1 Tax=Apilactobacillus apinorum TaxID=1218495 RepID=UPI0006B5A19E|nr:DNA polymerase III subunit alpha [Apilactobacillus apinorum]KOY68914.1 DNA-directed DNA polymerase III, alpha chain [Apilactobacillus apinorum]CAI2674979.1 DNA-directed DNA polymerase III, alpha chain [Apilactobacillus apinorum]
MDYTPLNLMSSYSLLNSTISIDELISTAKQRGYKSLALTDENNMYGAIEFYDTCIKEDIHPIIGLTIDLEAITTSDSRNQLVLLAKDNEGYKNLMKISTKIMTNESETIELDNIYPYLSHTVVIIPDYGEWMTLFNNGDLDTLEDTIQKISDHKDDQSVFMGLSEDNIDNVEYRNFLTNISTSLNIQSVASSKVQLINQDDYFALQVMKKIDQNEKFPNPLNASHEKTNKWLDHRYEVIKRYIDAGLEELVLNNQKIADSTNVVINKKQPVLPHYVNDLGLSSKEFLKKLCVQGLRQRVAKLKIDKNNWQTYIDRLGYELSVIDKMGFNDYFLIVWDVINYAHSQNIMTGPGRGSAAGSLVSFCLFITDVDPIQYDLLFERFLNEERRQMPDIDLDIPDNKRDVVLNYVHDKYGDEHVSQIVTFDTMSAKQVIRDIGRTFGLSRVQQSDWSRAIPSNQLRIKLSTAYKESQRLQNLVNDNPLNKLMFDTAIKLEGRPRHSGTHAAGVILSDTPIVETSPLKSGNEELLLTQYSKDYVEQIGLLKMDFLGLRNLSILAEVVSLVQQNVDSDFDIEKIDLTDAKTLKLFQDGDTNGVFQFESTGIKRVLKAMHPDNFGQISAVNALYRPGPMQNIDSFIRRKEGKEPVDRFDPNLDSILLPTYGIIVYQEQVMQVASVMGGFTLGEADNLRRAMSKKKKSTMDALKNKFVSGAINKGYSEPLAIQTFDYIEKFAGYGFNKSHAVAYSKMAFELAYLKTNYSLQFFVAVLNSVLNNNDKTNTYVVEAKKRDILVEHPNINKSEAYFSESDGKILFGLSAVKGLRKDFIQTIIEERNLNGEYKGLEEFIYRMPKKFRNVDLLKSLAYVGAFDDFGYNRAELSDSIEEFISSINLSGASQELFSTLKPKIKHRDDMTLQEKLSLEMEYTGVYLSGHPVEDYDVLKQEMNITTSDQMINKDENINTLIYVENVKEIRTKKGEQMAFINGTDMVGNISVTVFPTSFKKFANLLKRGIVLLVTGKTDFRNNEVQVIANQILPAANVKSALNKKKQLKKWYLKIDESHNDKQTSIKLYEIMQANHGDNKVIIYNANNNSKKELASKYSMNGSKELYSKLIQLLGNGNVIYK